MGTGRRAGRKDWMRWGQFSPNLGHVAALLTEESHMQARYAIKGLRTLPATSVRR